MQVRACKINISSSLCGKWGCLCVIFAVLVLFYGRFYSPIVLLFMVMSRFSIAKTERTAYVRFYMCVPCSGGRCGGGGGHS